MSRPRTAQEFIHWLEAGAGARWLRRGAVGALVLLLSGWISWRQFHGAVTESTLVQADMGRQLARGHGFTTQVNYPQTAAFLRTRGERFDPAKPYPELHHAPLYALVIAGGLWLVPEANRAALFGAPPAPPDGFAGDYFLLGLNLVLLWTAAGLTYGLGRRLFAPRVGALAAGALLLAMPLWQQTVAINGMPLLMVVMLGTFWAWVEWDAASSARAQGGWAAGVGAGGGLLFLAEYSAGAIMLVAVGYGLWRFVGRVRWWSCWALVLGFGLVTGPWIARNVAWTGYPTALAVQNVALKAGDPTAEPVAARASLSADLARIDLNKLGNKTLTAVQENLKAKLWSGGALWLTAFFVAGALYPFRSEATNRLRWVFVAALAVAGLAQAAFNSGESDRGVTGWLAPLVMIFGAGFFHVLLDSNPVLSRWPRTVASVLLAAQALPLVHDALEPRRLHFQYPPYLPGLFQGMRRELEQRGAHGRWGLMADVPGGVAWYGDTRVWAQPVRLRDFYAVTLEQPIGELLLTPRTLDRPFFTDLNAKPLLPDSLAVSANRFGDWGEIYAGLLTGKLPREFPLQSPQRLMENLHVLVNPALPPVRGK